MVIFGYLEILVGIAVVIAAVAAFVKFFLSLERPKKKKDKKTD
ncbi:MAG: hypothetical protein Q4G33_06550 [bacterium]|nr:hypothetical protein [bacterium]